MEILWKGTVSAWFRAIRRKLCGDCAFPQNFRTRNLGEITVFFAGYKFLQNAKDRFHNGGGKEKAAKYYVDNQEVLRDKPRNQYRNLSKEEKETKREYGRNRFRNIKENNNIFLYGM